MALTQVFNDSFTEASDTALVDHTPEIGTGWIASSFNASGTDATVESSDDTLTQPFYSASTYKFYWINVSETQNDYQSAYWTRGSSTGPRAWRLMVRVQDGSSGINGYALTYSGGSSTWFLYKYTDGSTLTLKSWFDATGFAEGDQIGIVIDAGNNITCWRNGSELTNLAHTDSSSPHTGGVPGIGTLKTVDSGGITAFEAWMDVAGGGAPYIIVMGGGTSVSAGQSVGLLAGRYLSLLGGTATAVGQAVNLTYTPGGGATYTLAMGGGTSTGVGQVVGLTASRLLAISAATSVSAGQSVGLYRGYPLTLTGCTSASQGQALGLSVSRYMALNTAISVSVGQAVRLFIPGTEIVSTINLTAYYQTTVALTATYDVVFDSNGSIQ